MIFKFLIVRNKINVFENHEKCTFMWLKPDDIKKKCQVTIPCFNYSFFGRSNLTTIHNSNILFNNSKRQP